MSGSLRKLGLQKAFGNVQKFLNARNMSDLNTFADKWVEYFYSLLKMEGTCTNIIYAAPFFTEILDEEITCDELTNKYIKKSSS